MRFQADFDQYGDIRVSPSPFDSPRVVRANGLLWPSVYKAVYILCSSWSLFNYLVGDKYRTAITKSYRLRPGAVRRS